MTWSQEVCYISLHSEPGSELSLLTTRSPNGTLGWLCVFDCWTHPTIYYWWDDNAVLGIKNAIQVSVPFNRCCLLRFTYMLYQISHIPDWVPGIFPSSSSGLGAKSVTSEVKIEVSTVVLVKKHTQKKIFFWKFQKMQFLAFMAKNYDFLWVWGVEKVATIYFKARRPKKIFFYITTV